MNNHKGGHMDCVCSCGKKCLFESCVVRDCIITFTAIAVIFIMYWIY